MQRLTKYSLLLKAVLKKTDDVNQKKDLVEMVRKRTYTVQINKYLRQFLRGIFENILKEWFSLTDYLYFAENTCHFVESLYFWNFFVDDSETQF